VTSLALVGEMMGGVRGGGARERGSGGVQAEAAARRAVIRVRRVRFERAKAFGLAS
jgi:hypothetical protein